MARRSEQRLFYQALELDGVRYAVLRESQLHTVCELARLPPPTAVPSTAGGASPFSGFDLDNDALARRLVGRRRRVGLSQTELARRAGIRVETLNRVERGKTTPDFSTVRKLVIAMKDAEADLEP